MDSFLNSLLTSTRTLQRKPLLGKKHTHRAFSESPHKRFPGLLVTLPDTPDVKPDLAKLTCYAMIPQIGFEFEFEKEKERERKKER